MILIYPKMGLELLINVHLNLSLTKTVLTVNMAIANKDMVYVTVKNKPVRHRYGYTISHNP